VAVDDVQQDVVCHDLFKRGAKRGDEVRRKSLN